MHTSVAAKDMFKYAYRDNFCHDELFSQKLTFVVLSRQNYFIVAENSATTVLS